MDIQKIRYPVKLVKSSKLYYLYDYEPRAERISNKPVEIEGHKTSKDAKIYAKKHNLFIIVD